MSERLRAVIADDHYLVREGVRRALTGSGEVEVVADAGSAIELEVVVDHEVPDVVVTDIRMPPGNGTDGIEAAHRIRARHPSIGVVVLSQYNDAAYAMDLLRHGTAGLAYLLKERIGDPATLVGAVQAVAAGGSRLDPAVVEALVRAPRREASPLGQLTEREHDVLELMAQGRSNSGIAGALHLSESSIEKYATSVFAKLGLSDEPHLHRRVAAVIAFLHEEGLAQPIEPGQ
ncbi:response regulator transcription factor [Agromyces sp. SYSU T00194]|uniref:response regulator transcription factor n=1 Tax=Agromyces chitinivorans TaxID=3158560 RepID=UPI0033951C00